MKKQLLKKIILNIIMTSSLFVVSPPLLSDDEMLSINLHHQISLALENGDCDIEKQLKIYLQDGGDPDLTDPSNNTLLHVAANSVLPTPAAEYYDLPQTLVRLLLDFGANPSIKNGKGKLPIELATGNACSAIENRKLLREAETECEIPEQRTAMRLTKRLNKLRHIRDLKEDEIEKKGSATQDERLKLERLQEIIRDLERELESK